MKHVLTILVALLLALPAVAQLLENNGTQDIQILNGQSLTAGVVAIPRGCIASAIVMPASWTAANLTFQVAPSQAGTYGNRYDAYGAEYTVVAAQGRTIDLPPSEWLYVRYFKIRSGIVDTPVAQSADRTLTVLWVCPSR